MTLLFMSVISKLLYKIKLLFYPSLGSFFIVAGWNWYHLAKRPHLRFVLISIGMWAALMIAWLIFKRVYHYLTIRFRRHPWWQKEFYTLLDSLYLTASLAFLAFFSKSESLTLGVVGTVFLLLFWQSERFLKRHPENGHWVRVNRIFFFLGLFIFAITGFVQAWSRYYYILDPNALIFNIVLFRALALTIFWLLLLALASLAYWFLPKVWRFLPIILWTVLFILYLIFWAINTSILYFSDLYLSPVILEHAGGGGGVIMNQVSYMLAVALLGILVIFVYLLRKFLQAQKLSPKRYWYYYNFLVIMIAVGILTTTGSIFNSPEVLVIKSFYGYWFGTVEKVELNYVVQKKMEKFGLNYQPEEFYVARRENIYTGVKKLLPEKFANQKPNIMIVFWESLSARLTDVYNPNYTDLTPGLDSLASDPHTTIFKNYYNAATPTITGLISSLCSILPPMGHEEIQNKNRLQRHSMLCLPEILQNNGYKYSSYITAVEKNFAHKDTIFGSMGVQNIYGTEELYKYIPGEAPLAWGWSDHQLFPATWNFMNKEAKEPFLMMLSTVDTHPPFNLAKDMVKYGNGDNEVLNSFHTTDNAFNVFWEQFKNSKFYNNTILIVVADHAIFPAAFKKKQFPDWAGKLNFYDENAFLMYVPESVLPKTIDTYSSQMDFTPTLLQILGINTPNNFEGHSIFDDRNKFPNLLGMHEFGWWISQLENGKRKMDFIVPQNLQCAGVEIGTDVDAPLTMCEYQNYFKWKRSMFEEGRFWFN